MPTRREFFQLAAVAAAANPRDEFRSPGKQNRPITWYSPASPDAAQIAADLTRLKSFAIGGICIFPVESRLKMPYLSGGYWNMIAMVVEEAVRQDLRVWLYDELDYPSSSAGGEVIRRNREYEVTALEYHDLAPGEQPPAGDVVATIPAGGRTHVFIKRVQDPLSTIAMGRAGLVRPLGNLLDANAVREFISSTYEGYARSVGRHFGKAIEAMFTDEPCLHTAGYWDFGEKPENHRPLLPWVNGFPEYFAAAKGYDIRQHLHALIGDAGPSTSQRRCDYWEVVCDLITRSYYDQLRDWCAGHAIAFSGHLLLEEGLMLHLMFSGSFIRNASRMHIPGMDLIGPRGEGVSLEDTMTRAGGPYVGKLLSSAAHTRGRSEVMSESFAASGYEMTLEKLIAVANWQFATGVTELMPMGAHYNMWRRSTDDPAARQFLKDKFFEDPTYYATYIGRVKSLLTGGVHVADVAVLVPEYSIWANYVPAEAGLPYKRYREKNPVAAEIDDAFIAVSMELLQNQLDFDYLDDEAFDKAAISAAGLRLEGERYGVLVMPPATHIRPAVVKKAAALAAAGGKVIAVGRQPEGAAFSGLVRVRQVVDLPAAVRRACRSDILVQPAERHLYFIHKQRDGRDIYFFANMAPERREFTISFTRAQGKPSVWDPRTGSIGDAVTSPLRLPLDRLSAAFVVF